MQLKSGVKSLEVVSQNTVDSIYKRQNNPVLLDCLVAQRNKYSSAKRIQAICSILVFAVAVLSAITSVVDVDWLTATSGLLSVLTIVSKKCFDKKISEIKREAATIQQFFDVALFSVSLGISEVEWYDFPGRNMVFQMIGETDGAGRYSVKNWYSDYSALPMSEQVFCCQKENIRWNKRLIQEYRCFIISFWSMIAVAMLIICFTINPSFVKTICVFIWLVPIADYAGGKLCEIKECYASHTKLDEFADGVEKNMGNDANAVIDSLKKLQNMIYESRCNSILIPDWFYDWRKPKHQKIEDNIAAQTNRI